MLAHCADVLGGTQFWTISLRRSEVASGEVGSRMHSMQKLVGKVVGPVVDGHVPGGVRGSGVDVRPVQCPACMSEHLVKEHALAATVAVAEGMHQRELGPVRRDGVGGGVTVSCTWRPNGDLCERVRIGKSEAVSQNP